MRWPTARPPLQVFHPLQLSHKQKTSNNSSNSLLTNSIPAPHQPCLIHHLLQMLLFRGCSRTCNLQDHNQISHHMWPILQLHLQGCPLHQTSHNGKLLPVEQLLDSAVFEMLPFRCFYLRTRLSSAHDHVLNRPFNRPLRPLIPVPDVDVGAADGRAMHPDQHILRSRLGDRRVDQFQADAGRGLGQGLHRVGHSLNSLKSWLRVHPETCG